ncbi:MAG: DNA recombination protein RmuC [Pirellulaceae bacterium]
MTLWIVVAFIVGVVIGALVAAGLAWLYLRQRFDSELGTAISANATELAVLRERLDSQSKTNSEQLGKNSELSLLIESCRAERELLASDKSALQATLNEDRENRRQLSERIFELSATATDHVNDLTEVKEKNAELSAVLMKEREEAKEKIALLVEAERKLIDVFKALAADTLKSNSESFLQLAKSALDQQHEVAKGDLEKRQQAIDSLIKPVSESIKGVDAKLADIEKQRAEAYGSLTQQVSSLLVTEEKLRFETSQLVKALRSPVARGRWGELQLKRVVEMAGMVEHCDFYQQQSVDTDGGRLRPDLLVRLPGNVHIVIDAKVPLAAFLEASEACDDETRICRFKDHARHVANHVEQLGKKAYWEQFESSPEFVVLFLPGEHFFTAALEYTPELIERGMEQKVVIATPMTLISLLKTVSMGWRQEKLAKNAEEISRLGKELYERLAKMAEHFGKVGKNLQDASKTYNEAVASLERRVLPSARKFRDLGASSADEIPEVAVIDTLPRLFSAVELMPAAKNSQDSVE